MLCRCLPCPSYCFWPSGFSSRSAPASSSPPSSRWSTSTAPTSRPGSAGRDAAVALHQRAEDHLDAPLQRAAGHHADHAAHRLHHRAGDQRAAVAGAARRPGCRRRRSRSIATVVGVAIATLLSMIIGELVPKNFALALPRQTAKLVMPFQVGFTVGLPAGRRAAQRHRQRASCGPSASSRRRSSPSRPHRRGAPLPRAPLGERRDASTRDTATLLARTLRVLRPHRGRRHDAAARLASVDRADPPKAVIDLARRTGYSRFPVIDDDIDDIVGLVHVKQAVAVPARAARGCPGVRPAVRAAAGARDDELDTLLGELRGRGYQMAVVVDEYGGTAGVVTLEDLVEELVGEVVGRARPRPGRRSSRSRRLGDLPRRRCDPTSCSSAPASGCPRTASTRPSAASS